MKGLKIFLLLIALLVVGIGISVLVFHKSIQPRVISDIENLQTFTAKRLLDTPIVHPTMHPILEKDGIERRVAEMQSFTWCVKLALQLCASAFKFPFPEGKTIR